MDTTEAETTPGNVQDAGKRPSACALAKQPSGKASARQGQKKAKK